MELLSFYALNIFVGMILSVVLGLYGSHLVARNKTLETILLGQAIQVGILLGVVTSAYFLIDHDDHGLHLEIIVSIIFTVIFYSLYEGVSRTKTFAKTPILVSLYTVLVSLSYLIVALSPIIESHMVKSFLGDIVTASYIELVIILIASVFFIGYFINKRNSLKLQSFDIASFGYLINSKGQRDYLVFNTIILVLMIYSIHVLGIIFTLAMMIFPVTIIQFAKLTLKGLYLFIATLAPLSVIIGFTLNIRFETLPTSALIILSYLFFGMIVVVLKKINK